MFLLLPPHKTARNRSQKNSYNFRGLSVSPILYFHFLKFSGNYYKELQLAPCFFNLVKLETISPAAETISPAAHFINCVNIERIQTIEAVTRESSMFLLENVNKALTEIFKILAWKFYNMGNIYSKMFWKAGSETYFCYYFSCPTLVSFR